VYTGRVVASVGTVALVVLARRDSCVELDQCPQAHAAACALTIGISVVTVNQVRYKIRHCVCAALVRANDLAVIDRRLGHVAESRTLIARARASIQLSASRAFH
jgi:hypothetical protein